MRGRGLWTYTPDRVLAHEPASEDLHQGIRLALAKVMEATDGPDWTAQWPRLAPARDGLAANAEIVDDAERLGEVVPKRVRIDLVDRPAPDRLARAMADAARRHATASTQPQPGKISVRV